MPTNVRDLITLHEERRSRAYRDSHGIWTGGVGRNLQAVPFSPDEVTLLEHNDPSRFGKDWSQWTFTPDEIELFLTNDIERAERGLRVMLPWFGGLNAARQAALIDMAFNLGVGGLAEFRKMLQAMQFGEWINAANEALDSAWERQVGKRAVTIAQMIKTGEWPA